jgi:hypothetical protein
VGSWGTGVFSSIIKLQILVTERGEPLTDNIGWLAHATILALTVLPLYDTDNLEGFWVKVAATRKAPPAPSGKDLVWKAL